MAVLTGVVIIFSIVPPKKIAVCADCVIRHGPAIVGGFVTAIEMPSGQEKCTNCGSEVKP